MTRYVLVDNSADVPRYFVRMQRQGPFTIALASYKMTDATRYTRAHALKLARTRCKSFDVERVQ